MRKPFALVSIVCLIAGCGHSETTAPASTTRAAVGSRVTWRGVAENHKVGAFLLGPGIFVDLPGTHWPSEVVGRTVEVRGTIVEHHDLPVFVADPNEPPVAGIPVPPGTDLHEASKRFVLEQVEWRVIRGGG